MAARLTWASGLLAAMLLLAFWLLPRAPGPELERRISASGDFRTPEERTALRELHGQVRLENQLLQHHLRADSVLRVLPDEHGLRVALPPVLQDTGIEERLRVAVRDELGEIDEPRVRLVLLVLPRDYGARPGSEGVLRGFDPGGAVFDLIYIGRDEGGPYCAVVAVPEFRLLSAGSGEVRASFVSPSRGDSLLAFGISGFMEPPGSDTPPARSILGTCAFAARHGPPGPGLEEWLVRTGGAAMGESLEPSLPLDADRATSRLPFGMRFWEPRIASPGAACQAGRLEACEGLFLHPAITFPTVPRSVAHSRFVESGFRLVWPPVPADDPGGFNGILAELETTFGSERFARFWGSDEDFLTAFSQAFGVSAGEWMAEWVQVRYGSEPRGPRVPPGTLVLSLLSVAALVGCSVLLGVKRSVG